MNRIFNVVLTVVLAIIATELGLYTVCVYSPFRVYCGRGYSPYTVAALGVTSMLFGVFFISQFNKTHQFFKLRKRAHPLPAGFLSTTLKTFERTAGIVWNTYDSTANDSVTRTLNTHTQISQGWVVRYNSGHALIVYERDFYYWLLEVTQKQIDWQEAGIIRLKSPISQRESGLTRGTWLAYRQLLMGVALAYIAGRWRKLNPQTWTDWTYWSILLVGMIVVLICEVFYVSLYAYAAQRQLTVATAFTPTWNMLWNITVAGVLPLMAIMIGIVSDDDDDKAEEQGHVISSEEDAWLTLLEMVKAGNARVMPSELAREARIPKDLASKVISEAYNLGVLR